MLRKYNNSKNSFRRSQKKTTRRQEKKRKVLEMKGGRSFSNMYKILVRTIFFSQREKNSFFVSYKLLGSKFFWAELHWKWPSLDLFFPSWQICSSIFESFLRFQNISISDDPHRLGLIQMNESSIPFCTFAALESKRRCLDRCSKTETCLHMFLRFEDRPCFIKKSSFDAGCL